MAQRGPETPKIGSIKWGGAVVTDRRKEVMNTNTNSESLRAPKANEVSGRAADRSPKQRTTQVNSCHKDEGHTEADAGINRKVSASETEMVTHEYDQRQPASPEPLD